MAEGAQRTVRYVLELRFNQYEVRELEGEEAISSPFRFVLGLRSDRSAERFDPEKICDDRAFLRLEREGEVLRRIRGVVTEVTAEAVVGGAPELTVVFEAELARARLRQDMRIFRDRTAPQIIEAVLEGLSIEWVSRLADTYQERPYCVQFRESDFDFISRLMEEEGISYFFCDDPTSDYDTTVPTLVLIDRITHYDTLPGEKLVPFAPAKGLVRAAETVYELGRRARMAPSAITLRDFNTDKPSLSLEVTAEGPSPTGQEYYDYPGCYQLPDEGQRLAQIKSEAMRCAAFQLRGASDCTRFAPGQVFTLEGAPENLGDGDRVLTRVRHSWEIAERPYANEFEAMDAGVIFRPEQSTPPPIIDGNLTGHVMGPAGSEIHPDEMGRVKVYFPWDRLQVEDDRCSHWFPVVQDNTGQSVAIPRVGWEVACGFREGNPDRPVVLGRVYNGADPPPELLPAGKTRTTIRSLTSPAPTAVKEAESGLPEGMGLGPATRDAGMTLAANEILIEDATGSELIRMQAQRDQNVRIANDRNEEVLNKETNSVVGNEDLSVGVDHDQVVGEHSALTVQGDQLLSVLANRLRNVSLDDTIDVLGLRTTIIGGMHIRRVATYDDTNVDALIEMVGGMDLEASIKDNTTNTEIAQSLIVGGAIVEAARTTKDESATTSRTEVIGGALNVKAVGAYDLAVGAARTTTVGVSMDVKAGEVVLLDAASALEMNTADGTFEGGTVVLQVGGSVVTISGSAVDIKADTIAFQGESVVGSSLCKFNS